MTRKEAMRQAQQLAVLQALGFTSDEAESLRRISMTLQRWHELECGVDGGCVEREAETGRVFWRSAHNDSRYPMADRETGARKRLAGILLDRNARMLPLQSPDKLTSYIQTDPRGAALYILRPGDVPAGKDADAYYNRGICVY